jgi:hypothetical protein
MHGGFKADIASIAKKKGRKWRRFFSRRLSFWTASWYDIGCRPEAIGVTPNVMAEAG